MHTLTLGLALALTLPDRPTQALADGLGDDDFFVREASQARLYLFADRSWDLLCVAQAGDDLEVIKRAAQACRDIDRWQRDHETKFLEYGIAPKPKFLWPIGPLRRPQAERIGPPLNQP